MKFTYLPAALLLTTAAFVLIAFNVPQNEPWTQKQLLDPRELAQTLNDAQAKQPLVLSVGPAAVIKNSVDIGPASERSNLAKLGQYLKSTPKDATIVIYCGCCPFEKCPNVRPAFELLNRMAFKNHRLLNLSHNVKMDWIDRGYPVSD